MSAILINLGGAGDRTRIDLATSKNRPIPNSRRSERAPAAMEAAKELVLNGHPDRQLRSLTATYNCIGMALANRRTCVEPEHVPMIFEDDGYVEIGPAKAMPGDLVLYRTEEGEISHIAVVVSPAAIAESASEKLKIRVLSQWGADGEYLHDYADVNERLGKPDKFYSERRRA